MADEQRRSHPEAECQRFLAGFVLEPPGVAQMIARAERDPSRSEECDPLELLGRALWDVFSDNHTVLDGSGTAYHLGSFRASAGLIADVINARRPQPVGRYEYLDFYLGNAAAARQGGLGPVYRWIFGRLRDAGCDWIYSFPRLSLIDMRGEAVRAERDRELDAVSAELDEAFAEEVRRALLRPLPAVVAAYRDVFGTLPEGWPHPDM